MSRTDKDMPARIQAMDAPRWMQSEWHTWCENETIDTARPYDRRGRAVYEKELIKYVDIEVEYVKMIDSNKVKFYAEYVTDWRRGKRGELIYDREEHPGAIQYRYYFWYGREWMKVRLFKREIVATPVYRYRLVHWEPEPRRECDIDKPGGECYRTSHLIPGRTCRCCSSNAVEYGQRATKRRVSNHLKNMAHEYNSYGEVGDDPPPKYPSDSWW